MPVHDRFGIQFLLGLSAPELKVVFRILNNTDKSVKGYTDCLETIQRERAAEMAKPEMIAARPEQRLFFCILGPDEVRLADAAIITEILFRVQVTMGHLEDTISSFKLMVSVASNSAVIRNRDSSTNDESYCYVRFSVSMGLVSMMTLESMVEDLIIHDSKTQKSMQLRIQDPLDASQDGQFTIHAERHSGYEKLKYLKVELTGFPSNDLINQCVFFITSAFEAKNRLLEPDAPVHCKNIRSSPAHRRTGF